jgi:hypothetical protein
MMQEQGIIKGDILQRIGSVGLILGAVLMIIAGILYPRISDISSTQVVLQTYADQELLTQICKFLFSIGIWTVLAGAMGIYRSISARGAAWARLGFYGILAGTAMFTIAWALTMAEAGAAANWVAAPDAGKATAYSVAATLHAASMSAETMSGMEYWLAIIFLGIGMVLSAVYPRWIGWIGIVLGIVTVVGMAIMALTGISNTIFTGVMVILILTFLWFLVVGIWVARKAW